MRWLLTIYFRLQYTWRRAKAEWKFSGKFVKALDREPTDWQSAVLKPSPMRPFPGDD